jgi:hypothetical protein
MKFDPKQLSEMRAARHLRVLSEDVAVDDDIETVFNELHGEFAPFNDELKLRAKKMAVDILNGHDLWRAIYNQVKTQAAKTFDLGDAHAIGMALMEIIYTKIVGADEGAAGETPQPGTPGENNPPGEVPPVDEPA